MSAQSNDPRDKKVFLSVVQEKLAQSRVHGNFHELLRAQPSLESLTGNSDWDLYLSCLQFFLEKAEKDKMEIDLALTDGDVFDHVKLIRMKSQSLCLGERIFTINQLMTLPKRIIEDGERVLQELMKQDQQKKE